MSRYEAERHWWLTGGRGRWANSSDFEFRSPHLGNQHQHFLTNSSPSDCALLLEFPLVCARNTGIKVYTDALIHQPIGLYTPSIEMIESEVSNSDKCIGRVADWHVTCQRATRSFRSSNGQSLWYRYSFSMIQGPRGVAEEWTTCRRHASLWRMSYRDRPIGYNNLCLMLALYETICSPQRALQSILARSFFCAGL